MPPGGGVASTNAIAATTVSGAFIGTSPTSSEISQGTVTHSGSAATNTVAVGLNVTAANGTKDSVLVGENLKQGGYNGTVIGINSSTGAGAINATAVGANANAAGNYSTALGNNVSATADAVAIGTNISAAGYSVAVGSGITATNSSVSIGDCSTTPYVGDIAIGAKAASVEPNKGGSSARDTSTNVWSNMSNTVVGYNATAAGQAGDTIIGARATNDWNNDFAIGQSTAIGSRSFVYGDQATALAADSSAIGNSSLAIGGDDTAKAWGALNAALGTELKSIGVTNGRWRTDSRTIANMTILANKQPNPTGNGVSSTLLVSGSTADAAGLAKTYSTDVRTAAIGDASIAIGPASQSGGVGSQAIGLNAISSGVGSIAQGIAASSYGSNSIAMGSVATANTQNSVALGYYALAGNETAATQNATALGTYAHALGADSVTIGTQSCVTGNNSVALGPNIKSLTTYNSVVLGNGSTEVVGTTGASDAVLAVPNATVRTSDGTSITYEDFAGEPTDAGQYVSVGKVGGERQIKNVAAGAINQNSTDAINGSQLYSVSSKLVNGFNITATANGGTVEGTADSQVLIGQNEQIKLIAGDNVKIVQSDQNFTFSVDIPDVETPTTTLASGFKATVGTAPDSSINPDEHAATLGDVLNSGWNLQDNSKAIDFVQPYDTVNFVDGNGTYTTAEVKENGTIATVQYSIKTDNKTVHINADNEVEAITTGINYGSKTEYDDGKVELADSDAGSALVNASTVVNAINNAAFTVTAVNNNNQVDAEDDTDGSRISAADNITYAAGKNLNVAMSNTGSTNPTITYGLTENITVTNITVQDDDDESPIKIGDNAITGLTQTLPNVSDSPTVVSAPTVADTTKAATLGDILNIGWNLQNNDVAKDFVKGYDTVNFVNGNGTEAVVDMDGDTVAKVKYNVKTDGTTVKVDDDGNVTAVTGDLTNEDGKVKTPENGEALVNASTVADAINNSGFKLTTAKTGTGTVDGTTEELVNPSETVTITAGDNIAVTQDGNNITIAAVVPEVPKSALNSTTTDGKAGVVADDAGNGFVNATNVAEAINSAYHTVSTSNNDDQVEKSDKSSQISAGDNVTYAAGKNLVVKMENEE
ncbi:beta strand repeat-containing protein, partial [Lonepinella sp. BR2474]|uniref:beta strand repeat-containing protein n=1 Tax=Lonepinella sp. BR2474 TaxID=3434548 RepID=UPI003F6E2B67